MAQGILLFFYQRAPHMLAIKSIVHRSNVQTSNAFFRMATTVVEQKGIAIAIVVQYMDAIDTLLNLQKHVVAGPVPSVATKFKCDKERRLGKFGFFVFPLTAAAAVVSI